MKSLESKSTKYKWGYKKFAKNESLKEIFEYKNIMKWTCHKLEVSLKT